MTEEIHDTAPEVASIEAVPLPDDVAVSNRIVVEHLNIYDRASSRWRMST